MASILSSNPNGASAAYAYDDLSRLSTVVDDRLSGSNTTTYTYDWASNLATATYPNGLQSIFNYDALNRLSAMATPVSGYTYQRGAPGNLTSATELNGRTITWNYDGIYRLTNESVASDPNQVNGSVSYSLDPVGNRLSDTSSLTGISSSSGTYNADDELSSETYDANGNTLSTGGKSFTYDAENDLTGMTSSSTVVSIVYDAFGNRVAKTVNGVTTRYLVDDLNPTGYPQVVEELVGGAVIRQYTYGLQRISENQVVSNTWTPSFYGYDGGGNVRQLTDVAGAVTDTYEYDAFGVGVATSGHTPNEMLYRGEQYDCDLGLYYLRARYYNPTVGRFLTRDPEEGEADSPATIHKYIYADGDPVDLIDPTGDEAAVSYNQLVLGALVLGTGASILNYEQHKDQTDGALRELGAGISCAFHELTTLTHAWVAVGLAGTGDAGTVSRIGPCAFAASIPKATPVPISTPIVTTGPPQKSPRCQELARNVDIIKSTLHPRRCNAGMPPGELMSMMFAWQALADARALEHEECYNNQPDLHHQEELDKALQNESRCLGLLIRAWEAQ